MNLSHIKRIAASFDFNTFLMVYSTKQCKTQIYISHLFSEALPALRQAIQSCFHHFSSISTNIEQPLLWAGEQKTHRLLSAN